MVDGQGRPRVLLLSTHGFFLTPQPVEDSPALGLEDEPRGRLSENPLLRCGIVLAGANQLADAPKDGTADDGLLTGLEIVACDLRGTELPDSIRQGQRLTGMTSRQESFPIAPSKFAFAQHGKCGAWVSELMPHTAEVVDDLCFIKTMFTEAIFRLPTRFASSAIRRRSSSESSCFSASTVILSSKG